MEAAENGSLLGQTVPSLTFTNLDGETEALDALRDQWVLLVFHRHLA